MLVVLEKHSKRYAQAVFGDGFAKNCSESLCFASDMKGKGNERELNADQSVLGSLDDAFGLDDVVEDWIE